MVTTRSKARNYPVLIARKQSGKKPRVTFAKELEHVIKTLSRNNAAAEQREIQRRINLNSHPVKKNVRNTGTFRPLFNAHFKRFLN